MWLFTHQLHAHLNLAMEYLKHQGLPHDRSPRVQLTSLVHGRGTVIFGFTLIPRRILSPNPYWIPHCLFWKERNANSERFWVAHKLTLWSTQEHCSFIPISDMFTQWQMFYVFTLRDPRSVMRKHTTVIGKAEASHNAWWSRKHPTVMVKRIPQCLVKQEASHSNGKAEASQIGKAEAYHKSSTT